MKYIDLGLPSGNLWAEQNEEGYYTFDEAVAKFGDNMPTKDDFEELVAHCWKRWDNERNGMEFAGDNGAKLFLPALGVLSKDVGLYGMKDYGCYWSATPFGDGISAYCLNFYSDRVVAHVGCRGSSRTVRLIKRGGTQ